MLSTSSLAPSTSMESSGLPSPTSDIFDDNSNRLSTYLHQLAGCYEMEVDVIVKDHCYARPWNWKPENIYVKPTKKLFFTKNNAVSDIHRHEDELDVEENSSDVAVSPLDFSRCKHHMDELQRLANFARPDENDDWEDKIDKTQWTPVQNRIFSKVMKIFSSERLARLAKSTSPMEPVYRRTSVDIATRRFREILASIGWDWRIAQWLHSFLFDHLPQEHLAIYLDILQTLKVKIPQLIDKMIAIQPNISAKGGSITWETLGSLLKRTWDPVASSLNINRLKKLPGNPILIITPAGIGSTISSRQHKWASHLSALGTVVNIHTHLGLAANRMTMMVCIDQLVQATRTKIQDVRADCPGRPIILVGFNTGAALACQVAQMEHVTAVICLGFPFMTVEGKRGTPDDTLMDIRCPVMFVIGQNAALVQTDDLEDVREKMLVETSLVVVGTADDNLRISTAKKISEGITQNMVDRCILDEIGDFVGSILLQPHPLPLRPMTITNYENKNNKKEARKRKNSTSSSVESEPNSPIVKKSRPSTPLSSALFVTNTMSGTVSKTGTFNTQSTLVSVGTTHINHSSTTKRKPRVINNPKSQFVEHYITSRYTTQQSVNTGNGGITLNIGSLASLAPIGPIRLAPATIDQSSNTVHKGNQKSSIVSTKMPKIIATSVPLQNVSKVKAIVSTNKGFSKVISNNYKHVNTSDKTGNTKLVNVLTATGNQVKLNSASANTAPNKAGGSNGTLTNIMQNGKNTVALTTNQSSARPPSTSSILLASNNSGITHSNATSATSTKELDNIGKARCSQHVVLGASRSLEISKISQLPHQTTSSNDKDVPLDTSCGNVIMFAENSHETRAASSSVIVPFNNQNAGSILSLSNKQKAIQKTIKTIPKITVNACNLQRIQRNKSQSALKKNFVNELDDDLGNILDIPIIFAKDDDNLNLIEKAPSYSQIPLSEELPDKNIPKFNSGTTKVVLISNKQDKLAQQCNNVVTPAHTIICPNIPAKNVNHVILQTRAQNSTKGRAGIPLQTRVNQPTIKYTKIILAKKNSLQSSNQCDKNEQIILTKSTQKSNLSKISSFEKNEHRYAQPPSEILQQYQEDYQDDVLEIEDAIKTNIIQRKCVNSDIAEIDPMLSNFRTTNRLLNDMSLCMEHKMDESTFKDSDEL